MNEKPQEIETVEELLAYALELEEESVDRYETLADEMEIHHKVQVAELFRCLAEFSEVHAGEVRQRTAGIPLPKIPPWEFKWNCPGSPEGDCMDEDVSYQMTTRQALELALYNETRGRDFYAQVAVESANPEVRRLAMEMADEEAEHVALLDQWLAREEMKEQASEDDPGLPSMSD